MHEICHNSDILNEAAMMTYQYRLYFGFEVMANKNTEDIVLWWMKSIKSKKYEYYFPLQATAEELAFVSYAFWQDWCNCYEESKLVGDLLMVHLGGMTSRVAKLEVGEALSFIRKIIDSTPYFKNIYRSDLDIRKVFNLSVMLRVVEKWNIPCPQLEVAVPLEWGFMKSKVKFREVKEHSEYLKALDQAMAKYQAEPYDYPLGCLRSWQPRRIKNTPT